MKSSDTAGEKAIENYFISKKIGYAKQERWYPDGDTYVVVDFTTRPVPEKNLDADFVGIIEFDGQPAHFNPIEAFGGFARFFYTHNNDLVKDMFFEEMKMPFLRIRYDQVDSIATILDDFLNFPENYIAKHTKDNWENYYDEWDKNFRKRNDK